MLRFITKRSLRRDGWSNMLALAFSALISWESALAQPADLPLTALPFANTDPVILDEGLNFNSEKFQALEPEEAFVLKPPIIQNGLLSVSWQVQPEYYLYRDKFVFQPSDVTNLSFGAVRLPQGNIKQDPFFGQVSVVSGKPRIEIPISLVASSKEAYFSLDLGWQGCAQNQICYPPQTIRYEISIPPGGNTEPNGIWLTKINASVVEPSKAQTLTESTQIKFTPLSEQDQIAANLASSNIGWTALSFLGFGLLLAFTPCVFPMIPILSGIISGQKALSTRKAFALSLTYVLAMALTYTLAGVVAALFGQNLQATFQNPWVLSAFSGVFVLLALSMFGFYELQIPTALQSRLTAFSNRQVGGTLVGVAVMGSLSALIVGPCVAAPLAGALIYISQTGDAVLGGVALFSLSMGMGVPLLLIGTSAGKWLPRAGAWMEAIRAAFGVLLLAMAIWLLERVFPQHISLMLWSVLFLVSSVYLGAFNSPPENTGGWPKFWRGIGLVLALYGGLLMIGASSGGQATLMHPLKGLGISSTASSTENKLEFHSVTDLYELHTTIKQSRGQPVMVDFYADWCTSCKEMENYTFTDNKVRDALANYVLIKVDVTNNSSADKAIMRHYQIVGPPATLFFSREGKELSQQRLVGYVEARDFEQHVRNKYPHNNKL